MDRWIWEATIDYRTFVEQVPTVLYVSPQVEEMLGYAPEEWLADPELWVKILHTEDRERVLAEAARARETGEPFTTEYRLASPDGQVVWVRDEAAPGKDEKEHVRCWQGVLLDITERKEAEEAIRKSEERFRLVAKATGEAIWDNDLITGTQEWAGATEALFGYPPNQSEDAAWWEDRIHPEDKVRVLSGLKAVYDGDEEAWSDEYRFRRADGAYAIVADRGHVVRNERGRAVRMVGSMADVTERRQMEEALRESEKRFRITFEAAAVGMAHVAPDGRWLRINDRLCEISGYGREELLGLTFLDLTPSEDLDASLERVRRILEGRLGPYSMERRYVRKDGSHVWVSLSVSLARKLSGDPDYLICVADDITEHKIAELVPDPLTPREIEVLRQVAVGRTNQQIARSLAYSMGTIKHCIQCAIAKLGVENRKQAAARAVEIGLIAPPRY